MIIHIDFQKKIAMKSALSDMLYKENLKASITFQVLHTLKKNVTLIYA